MSLRKALLTVVVVVALLAVAVPAFAVKYGQPDGGEHPYVGMIVFYDQGMVPQWRCTGTLISPTLVLTAGHCTELNGPAQVWFQEDVRGTGYPYSGGVLGQASTYPVYYQGQFPNRGDVGVVVLSEPQSMSNLPTLAGSGYLDGLATQRGQQNVNFEVVGYGLQSVKPNYSAIQVRMKANVQLVNLRSALTDGFNIQTTNNPGKGTGPGGTCFGDSGGAIFAEGHQIVAVNSFVLNENCAGAAFGYRVDRQEVLDWIWAH